MTEGSDRVRTIRQHLRSAAALLNDGRHQEALAEVDAALALDAHNLPSQALRDRIVRASFAAAATQPATPPPAPADDSSFVPYGVNAERWKGFEQRIQERRFRALLETVNTSIVAGDAIAARLALEEARELRPDAPEIEDFEARVAVVPIMPVVAGGATPGRVWIRAFGALSLLLFGVTLLIGLEWLRPSVPATTVPVMIPATSSVASVEDVRPADRLLLDEAPEAAPVVADVAVPAEPEIADEVEASAAPRPTSMTESPSRTRTARATSGRPPTPPRSAPVATRQAPVSSPQPMPAVERSTPVAASRDAQAAVARRPVGEIPDDYVARQRPVRSAEIARATPDVAPASGMPDIEAPATASAVRAGGAPVVPAVGRVEQTLVEDVLQSYARAYGNLDASAARAVWPTVDEKALARAFQGLESQDVSFDECDIQIRGAVANASCRGQASYVGKVGSREPRTESRLWRFELRRDGDAWKIENAEARRQPVASYRDK